VERLKSDVVVLKDEDAAASLSELHVWLFNLYVYLAKRIYNAPMSLGPVLIVSKAAGYINTVTANRSSWFEGGSFAGSQTLSVYPDSALLRPGGGAWPKVQISGGPGIRIPFNGYIWPDTSQVMFEIEVTSHAATATSTTVALYGHKYTGALEANQVLLKASEVNGSATNSFIKTMRWVVTLQSLFQIGGAEINSSNDGFVIGLYHPQAAMDHSVSITMTYPYHRGLSSEEVTPHSPPPFMITQTP